MNEPIVFTMKELIFSGLWIALILLVVYIILLIRQFVLAVKDVRMLIQERRAEIDDILIKTPGIMDNVEKITGVTAKGMNSAYNGASKIAKKFKKKDNVEEETVDEIIIG